MIGSPFIANPSVAFGLKFRYDLAVLERYWSMTHKRKILWKLVKQAYVRPKLNRLRPQALIMILGLFFPIHSSGLGTDYFLILLVSVIIRRFTSFENLFLPSTSFIRKSFGCYFHYLQWLGRNNFERATELRKNVMPTVENRSFQDDFIPLDNIKL